jgi:hypothetical protein
MEWEELAMQPQSFYQGSMGLRAWTPLSMIQGTMSSIFPSLWRAAPSAS